MRASSQKTLYLSNRARLQRPQAADPVLDAFEANWIAERLDTFGQVAFPDTLTQLQAALDSQIAAEQQSTDPSAAYVAQHMSRDAFRVLVQEFAIDGLTEAQVFYFALPRLPLPAQMPLLRIMIDEFGSGNLKRAHTTLYEDLLRELDMPLDLEHYLDQVEETSFEFVNLFFWLALRADDPSYFAGALTYLETAIPAFFECYAQGCHRLGIGAHAYYTEHQHIDGFHAIEGQRLLKAMSGAGCLHPGKAFLGIKLASLITDAAFQHAVRKAQRTAREPAVATQEQA
ncbi:Uncharacterised protein [Bordetella ansorpii]|uniref:Iron-containing redox enzyme family protein n=1 Tax=Bordetella ansorpii TaxID=288768 RepID=A0A157SRK2_9BORD|nr:iron-containing redox enzyme family protein [Bordetella ansorpii]SAI73100.1 Uncharacterised protein [Bordetella ansorpii]